MRKATLTYTAVSNNYEAIKSINLESGSLFYIDECTKGHENLISLQNSYLYYDRIKSFLTNNNTNKGKFSIEYVINNEKKEKLPLLLGDDTPIFNRDNVYEYKKSEIEKARKLLFNSKNKMFLKAFLRCKKFTNTLNFNVKISYKEYLYANKLNIKTNYSNGEYYLNTISLFNTFSSTNKIKILRPVVEDALEIWKKNMFNLSNEDLYYFSRNLRIFINEYYKAIKIKTPVKNLCINQNVINKVFKHNIDNHEKNIVTSVILHKTAKRKILV